MGLLPPPKVRKCGAQGYGRLANQPRSSRLPTAPLSLPRLDNRLQRPRRRVARQRAVGNPRPLPRLTDGFVELAAVEREAPHQMSPQKEGKQGYAGVDPAPPSVLSVDLRSSSSRAG